LDFFRTGFTAARNASMNVGGFGVGFFVFGAFFLISLSSRPSHRHPHGDLKRPNDPSSATRRDDYAGAQKDESNES